MVTGTFKLNISNLILKSLKPLNFCFSIIGLQNSEFSLVNSTFSDLQFKGFV